MENNNGYTVITEEKKKGKKIYKIIMIIVITVFVTFILTSVGMYSYLSNQVGKSKTDINTILGGLNSSSNYMDLDDKLAAYKQVLDKYYLGNVDESKLEEGAVKGYVEGVGDKYTEYISKEDMNDYTSEIMGNYTGVGIYMVKDTKTNKIEVLSPIKNSPAEKAGILPKDLIKSVDGVDYTADDMTTASNKIKGEEGSTVKLEIIRDGKVLNFELKREKITVNPVEGEVLNNNIGYISFSSFDENTASEFKAKYEELKSKGIKSLIIDLRNNGGGIVDEATKIADYILDKGSTILYEVDKNNNEKEIKSESDPIINMPIVVLVNGNTASSSEILSGALKDLKKATIIGTKTYGKGVIQQILTLSDGSGIKVTTEEYQTPNRNKINEIGIDPDVTVELPDTVENVLSVTRDQDTQLQKAIEILK